MDLYRLPRNMWALKVNDEIVSHGSIETVSDNMLALGVRDDDIDAALIELQVHEDTRANFGVNGGFVFSDKEVLDELLGVA